MKDQPNMIVIGYTHTPMYKCLGPLRCSVDYIVWQAHLFRQMRKVLAEPGDFPRGQHPKSEDAKPLRRFSNKWWSVTAEIIEKWKWSGEIRMIMRMTAASWDTPAAGNQQSRREEIPNENLVDQFCVWFEIMNWVISHLEIQQTFGLSKKDLANDF